MEVTKHWTDFPCAITGLFSGLTGVVYLLAGSGRMAVRAITKPYCITQATDKVRY